MVKLWKQFHETAEDPDKASTAMKLLQERFGGDTICDVTFLDGNPPLKGKYIITTGADKAEALAKTFVRMAVRARIDPIMIAQIDQSPILDSDLRPTDNLQGLRQIMVPAIVLDPALKRDNPTPGL